MLLNILTFSVIQMVLNELFKIQYTFPSHEDVQLLNASIMNFLIVWNLRYFQEKTLHESPLR